MGKFGRSAQIVDLLPKMREFPSELREGTGKEQEIAKDLRSPLKTKYLA